MTSSIPKEALGQGLEKTIQNADSHLEKARTFFHNGDYQAAVFFGFCAWEEYGKAFFIREKMGEDITRREWGDPRSFRGHKAKIQKAYEEDHKTALKRVKVQAKEILGHDDVELSMRDISDYVRKTQVVILAYRFTLNIVK